MIVTSDIFIDLYVTYFNLIFSSGIIPDAWQVGLIRPIYKKKGELLDPNSYRPITILSCFGKLFTSILNERLSSFLESNNILTPAQAGFRKGYSTIDNIFVIDILCDLLKKSKKKLYCAFIDFSKAFDSVWRAGLWFKLIKSWIRGKLFNLIKSLYNNIKSCVISNNNMSDLFGISRGVRQGENLSPLLFSIFVNDAEECLFAKNCKGIVINRDNDSAKLGIHLIVLLYADDTVLFGDSPSTLQNSLDHFHTYCCEWKLEINKNKSKVVIFGGGPSTSCKTIFKIGDCILEILDSYVYLGVRLHRNMKYNLAIKDLCDSASKAMFSLLKKSRNACLPIDCIIKTFDVMVVPILLYGSEIWGYNNISAIEKVHLKFLKLLTGLRQSTPTYMLYGELGRRPLYIGIAKRMITFWHKLNSPNPVKMSSVLLKIIYNDMDTNNTLPSMWILHVKQILNDCGLSYIFNNPNSVNTSWLASTVENILNDQFIQNWRSTIDSSSKGAYYKYLKQNHSFEKYLLLPKSISLPILKFRTSNHNLPVETGRWYSIPKELRTCPLCTSSAIGDEIHYLFRCEFFNAVRQPYIPKYFCSFVNMYKFNRLFSCSKLSIIKPLSKFISTILLHFK